MKERQRLRARHGVGMGGRGEPSLCRKIKWLGFLIPVLFSTCATLESERSLTEFSKYASLGIPPFYYPEDPETGSRVARALGKEFSEKGYQVLEPGLLETAMGEQNPWRRGLTASERKRFRDFDIRALVIGAVNRYDCAPHLGRGPHYLYSCHVSLSCMMIDLDTGEDVWSASGWRSRQEAYLTEEKLFQELLQELSVQIPTARGTLPKH